MSGLMVVVVYVCGGGRVGLFTLNVWVYRKNSKIWDTSNNCHNCPKIGKV